jgi:hypothetical protein
LLLFTGDQHGDSASNSVSETNAVASAGGKFTNFLWYPFGSITSTQVNTWLAAGHATEIHFDDTAEVDASGVGGSGASWNGMQNVLSTALSAFTANYPTVRAPTTTRNHFLIWVSRNAAGQPDGPGRVSGRRHQLTPLFRLPQSLGLRTPAACPEVSRHCGHGHSGFEQSTQYEDDIQLSTDTYSVKWDFATAKTIKVSRTA